jgi:hypothetical protein
LVVVIPSLGEAALLAGRIHDLARTRGMGVLLLGVASKLEAEDELRRRLALLAAFIRNMGVQVEVSVEPDADRLRGLRFALGEGDVLACCVDASGRGAGASWADLLSSELQRPVYVFEQSGYSGESTGGLLGRLAPWLGSLAILVGFLWLQFQVSQQGENLLDTALLVLSVPVEIALIWLCNSIFG